jgi:hypothetical protein
MTKYEVRGELESEMNTTVSVAEGEYIQRGTDLFVVVSVTHNVDLDVCVLTVRKVKSNG